MHWTEKEIKRLAKLASNGYDDYAIGRKLGRTEGAVTAKRHALKIRTWYHRRGILERIFNI